MSSELEKKNQALEQRVKLLEQAMRQSARIRQQFNDAQRELQASRGRYHALIQHAFDAILIIANNGEVSEANPTACALFDRSEQELNGLNIKQLIPSLQIEKFSANTDHRIHEYDGLRKDGEIVPLEVTASALDLEHDAFLSITARDISERKQADMLRQQIQHELEEMVAERNSELLKLNTAVEQASEILMVTTPDGTIEYINDAFERITGIAKQNALGKKPSILRSEYHEDAFFKKMWETISQGKSWEGRIINKRQDGSLFPALTSISPVFHGSSKEITSYVCISQDISEQEKMEKQMRQSQKMEAVGTLTSGIAHEFNNMLAGILGNLYLLKSRLVSDPKGCKQLATAEDLSQKAAQMIKQLLTFSHKDNAVMKPVNLSILLKESYKIASIAIPESTSLHGEFCPQQLMVQGDATQLQQILMNLLKNAHDACGKRGRVTVAVIPFTADASFRMKHPHINSTHFAHLQVRDNGCGIAKDDIARIFEPFFTTKKAGQGTGLGLSMIYGAIGQHDGVIEVDSAPGATSFDIYLPLIEKQEEAEMVAIEVVTGLHEKILHVDDDESIREITSEILASLNYSTVQAGDGEQAVALFLKNPDTFSLVILDVVMPKLGGVGAANLIRKQRPDIPLIFLTGYGEHEIDPDQLNMQTVVVLSKPFSVPDLSHAIQDLLSRA